MRASSGAIVVLGALASVAACRDRGAAGPAVAAGPAAAAAAGRAGGLGGAASCASCHAEIAEEWRASFHHVAFTDATFQASLALEAPRERPFCVGCHAPEGDAATGVGCASCHSSPHAAEESSASPRPQPSSSPGGGSGAAACARCHEFSFEGREELVQKTVSEHAASDFSAVSCASCHMPKAAGHPDHRFAAGHDPKRIARGLRVDATRSSTTRVRVTIQVDAGHAFPTGDMFRRARLLVFAEGSGGEIVASAERTFGRTWTALARGARTEAADTRIRGRWSEDVDLGEPAAPIARVRWSLVYERVVAARPPHFTLASSDVVAEGVAR